MSSKQTSPTSDTGQSPAPTAGACVRFTAGYP